MKWRLAIRLEIGLDVKADPAAEATEDVTVEPMDEDEQISEEVCWTHLGRGCSTWYGADPPLAQATTRCQVKEPKARQEAIERKEAT